MASTGKKGKKNKGKTVPLNDFLSNNTISWSDQVDEADKLGEFNRKPALPAAPRAARALELDETRIPKNPPYVAYLSNLSYELEEADILNAFVDLSISNVRLPRDEHSGRMKGFGYVEFSDRGSFICALQKHEATIRGRRIKIDVAENEGERRRGGLRDNRDRKSNYDSEKTMGDWRSGPRSEFSSSDDRRGPALGRKDFGGFRDRDSFDKNRGDRDSSWRDNERRFMSDRENRNNYGSDREGRSNFGSRRNYDESESNYSEPKTRAKLNLKPRTLPIEEIIIKEDFLSKKLEERLEQEKPPAASIFGQAKPVDTSAREREIEKRLEKEKEGIKSEKDLDILKTKNSEEELSSETKLLKPPHESKENIWIRKSLKIEAQNVSQEPDDKETNDLGASPFSNESEKEFIENLEDSSGCGEDKRITENESERERDIDNRYSRHSKNDNRYNDRNRESDRGYRKDDRWRDDKDRREKRDYDRRDRGYESDRRGTNIGGKIREQDHVGDSKRYNEKDSDFRRFNDRDSDSRRYNERDSDFKKFSNNKEGDWRKNNEKDGDNKRFQDRDNVRHKDQEDYGINKGSRGDRRSGPGDKGYRQVKGTLERERGLQSKDKPRDQKKIEDGIRMPKFKEVDAPNYVGTNKYSFLEEDGVSE